MTKTEFKWRPQDNYEVTHEPRVRVVKFGDGYEQRVKDGINNQLKRYQLSFIVSSQIGKEINEFLSARGAVESFTWLTSDDNQLRTFVCRSWTVNRQQVIWSISCTFEEVVA
ncbi:phage tail protein [Xenorhabdus bovienii]|uniref:phage tail protein n=1 Tax=Xenorhabdus bovienii TaxID=40576 RepID=UPI00237D29EB|nr:phage tail protein [Xenorhabdus bovienii]MDE1487394.1 phage tail protein [Xenorhabdus bovienii]MDE9478432.1 phage tail protein [Xenorhabdus bovienii]MDE9518779.1 phage tail protein [Xenorhabdus bovienii]MDE9531314.1 phage tail protein [Xenorhabdus bovienii]